MVFASSACLGPEGSSSVIRRPGGRIRMTEWLDQGQSRARAKVPPCLIIIIIVASHQPPEIPPRLNCLLGAAIMQSIKPETMPFLKMDRINNNDTSYGHINHFKGLRSRALYDPPPPLISHRSPALSSVSDRIRPKWTPCIQLYANPHNSSD